MQIRKYIIEFLDEVASGDVEIYNEFSLQHELGLFLRNRLKPLRVQFERNVGYFGFQKHVFTKKEIDLSVFSLDSDTLECIVELKYPRNGQVPEQMFSVCKDIQFCEQLCYAGFKNAFVLFLAEDKDFYSGKDIGIYSFFRAKKAITGKIQKPTGAKDKEVIIAGSYQANWKTISGNLKYLLIEIDI